MKNILLAVVSAVCLFAVTGIAQAVPYADVINYSQLMTMGSSHTYNFNLNNDVLVTGDIGPEDLINSAALGINFTDDEPDANLWSYEVALTIADSSIYLTEVQTQQFLANVLSQVQADHTLNVTVISLAGDFGLGDASLSGDYTDRPVVSASPVPEAATIVLLGMGVLGMVGLRRRFLGSRP